MDYVDIIKSKLLLSEVINKKVKLVRRGNHFIGLCPFHNEKTPSFSVTDVKGLYHCFGCSAHGDIFEFISQTEGLSFKDAVQRLACVAGVDIPKNFGIANSNQEYNRALDLAASWFSQQIQGAMIYLQKRNITPAMINKFKIGYAPYSGLKEHLNFQGIDDQVLTEVGLINKSKHDYFCNRLILPIYNTSGKTIAFGGRVLSSEQQPKYLNSPENKLFRKKENLYGLNFAFNSIHKAHSVFIVEGYMDVIALHQAGVSNVVAPLGTAVCIEQLKNLWKITKEISICMDGDSAGYNAALRIATLVLPALEAGYILKFITLPNNQDPYDLCNELKYNTQDILSVLNSSTQLHSEYLWHRIINDLHGYDALSPEKYSILEHKITKYINDIDNSSIRKYYRDYFYSKTSELRFTKQDKTRVVKKEYFCNKSPELIELEQNQAIILRIVIEFPKILNDIMFFEQFSYFEFSDADMKIVQQCIVHLISKKIYLKKETLSGELAHLKVIDSIFEKTAVLNSQLSSIELAKAMWNNIILLQEVHLLEKEKVNARLSGNFDLEEKLVLQITQIRNSIQETQMKLIHQKTN